VVARPAARLASAHAARFDDPLTKLDALVLVFSEPLDPVTIEAPAFSVVRADGRRIVPTRARLALAPPGYEHTVVLELELGAPSDPPPVHVAVVGPVWTSTGAALRGVAAAIRTYDQPDEVILARPAPASACAPSERAWLFFWSDAVVEADTAGTITFEGGREPAGRSTCVPSGATRWTISAGALRDTAGHPTGAVDVLLAG
jgi:hypothetical protein